VGFNRRTLKRLEKRGLAPCPKCGRSPDEPGRLAVKDGGTPTEGFPADPAERCSRCGRPLWTVVNIVYDEEGEGA
jgi:hypothetical protein